MDQKVELLKSLARCRVVEVNLAMNEHGLSLSDMEHLNNEKLIEEEVIKKNGATICTYVLTDKGESYIKGEIDSVNHLYRGFVYEQDQELFHFYAKLSPEIRDTWMTKDDFIVKYQLPGTVDGAYIDENGELVAVKAVSSKASYATIERVEKFLAETKIKKIVYLTFTQNS